MIFNSYSIVFFQKISLRRIILYVIINFNENNKKWGKNMTNKRFNIFLGIISLVAAVLYFLLCQGDLVWMDEAYTFGMIRRSYSDMCAVTALDVHPPLFYILLKTFALPFSNKLLAGKIFSVIPYVILIIFGGVQLRKLFSGRAGIAYGILFLTFPFMLKYAVEVRMYSLAALFVFINAVYAYRAYVFNTKKDWVLFTLFGLLSAYTHYFSLASTGIVYAILFIAIIAKRRELFMSWLLCSLVTVILYLPWFKFFIDQLKYKIDNEYWIEPITLKTLKSYFADVFGVDGQFVSAIASFCVSAVMIAGLSKSRKGDRPPLILAASVPVITLLAGLIASWIIRPVFVIRYLLPSVPLLIAAMAVGLSDINSRTVRTVLVLAAVVFGALSYSVAYYDRNTHFEDRIDSDFYLRNNDCDAYIVTVDTPQPPGHTETVLAYYETEKPIYQVIENYGYYPFENFRYIDDFNSDNYDRVILFLAEGKDIPDFITNDYECEYRETATSLWIMADVYLLTKH